MSVTRCLFLTAALLALASSSHAAPPKLDFTNLPAYITALNASTDPQAIAIRQEIANGPADLAKEQAAAQAAGIPLTAAALQQPLPPPGQNAAVLFQKLDAIRKAKPLNLPDYADALSYGPSYTPAQLAAVQKIIASRQDMFSLLHQAAQMPGCVFPKDWSLGPAVRFPEFAGLREDARELNTESYLLASQGHYSEAIANQELGFNIAHDAASGPTLLNYLVGSAIEAITLKGMQNILYLSGGDAGVDQQIAQAIAAHRHTLSLSYALKGEAAFSQVSLLSLQAQPANLPLSFSPASQKPNPLTPDQAHFALNLIDAAEAQALSLNIPFIVASDSGASFSHLVSIASHADHEDDLQATRDPVVFFSNVLIVVVSRTLVNHMATVRAEKLTTLAATAALAVKAQTGTFPDTLPGNFTDPFSGKPLGYQREGTTGFVVYSIGPQGTFAGGKPGQYQFTPFQVFFRYPGPPPQPVQS